ncbi:MAG TPA: DUF58 domain-containing protein [Actinomycetota bacterium]|nr:DUF58 domain-containing protein [Actinomycetota bacterium]
MNLTPRGRTLLVVSASFLAFGRTFALRELSMLGTGCAAAVVFGAIAVVLRRGTVEVERKVHPARSSVGAEVRVDLSLTAKGAIGTAPLLAEDRIPPNLGGTVRVTIDARASGRRVAYTFTPRTRGRYELGPLELLHTDPFGAVTRRKATAGTSHIVVYPSYDRIVSMPVGLQRLGAVRRSPLLGQGNEFYALRAYELGDDLRKVHWPTSAKLDQLVIRQDELLAEPRMVVLLDSCESKHRGEGAASSLEAAVSACASVAMLALRRRMRIQILTPDGILLRTRRPSEEELLEHLAMLQPSGRESLLEGLQHLPPRLLASSAVVAITPGVGGPELGVIARLMHAAVGGAVVRVVAETFGSAAGARRPDDNALRPLGVPVVRLRSGDSFHQVWESTVRDVAVAR